jgi:flagellar FliJ protein
LKLRCGSRGRGEAVLRPGRARGIYRAGFLEGLSRARQGVAEIDVILLEEQGARDALAEAFEQQKKYEQSPRTARARRARKCPPGNRALDELGLRKKAV